MATVGNRAIAYIASPKAPAAYAASAWHTVTVDLRTAEWLRVPFRAVQNATVTNGPELHIYRSADGGANFETIAMTAISLARSPSSDDRQILQLEGGLYVLAMQAGGPNTATLGIETCEILSAFVGN